jgi:hypothetical protein
MSKKANSGNQDSGFSMEELELDQDIDLNIEDDDFGFLIDSEGNLKTVFGCDDLFDDPPENVVKILEIFGIGSARNLSRAGITIH